MSERETVTKAEIEKEVQSRIEHWRSSVERLHEETQIARQLLESVIGMAGDVSVPSHVRLDGIRSLVKRTLVEISATSWQDCKGHAPDHLAEAIELMRPIVERRYVATDDVPKMRAFVARYDALSEVIRADKGGE